MSGHRWYLAGWGYRAAGYLVDATLAAVAGAAAGASVALLGGSTDGRPARRPSPVRRSCLSLLVLTAVLLAACGEGSRSATKSRPGSSMELTSEAFASGGRIPRRFTCDGADVPPTLAWSGAPRETGPFAIVMRERDARGGDFVHWVVSELPPGSRRLASSRLPPGADEMPNSLGSRRYRGPCPPRGDKPHPYVFTIYWLSERPAMSPDDPPSQSVPAIMRAAGKQGSLSGVYAR